MLFLLLCALGAAAQDPPTRETWDAWIAAAEKAAREPLEAAAARAETELAAALEARIDRRRGDASRTERGKLVYTCSTPGRKAELIGAKREAAAIAKRRLADAKPALPWLYAERIAAGQVGLLRRVLPSVAADEAESWTFDILQIIDANALTVRCWDQIAKRSIVLWIEAPTAGLVDGGRLDTQALLVEVAGTKRYETALGATNTVFLLRPFRREKR